MPSFSHTLLLWCRLWPMYETERRQNSELRAINLPKDFDQIFESEHSTCLRISEQDCSKNRWVIVGRIPHELDGEINGNEWKVIWQSWKENDETSATDWFKIECIEYSYRISSGKPLGGLEIANTLCNYCDGTCQWPYCSLSN